MDQELSLFVRDLYKGSTDSSIRNFQDWAMEKLKLFIKFDSALWADAIFDGINPPNVHNFYLHGDNFDKSTKEIIQHYVDIHEKGLAEDEIAIALTKNIGSTICWRDINGIDSAVWEQPIYEHFAKFYKQEHICSTSIANNGTEFLTFLSLYREDRDKPFSDQDKHIKSLLAPNLAESYRINLQFQALGACKAEKQKAIGLVDEYGAVFFESNSFQNAISVMHTTPYCGTRITDTFLLKSILNEQDNFIQHLRITSKKTPSGLFLVVIHTDSLFKKLTPKQREVLILYQQGKTYKEIAFILSISYHAIDSQFREIRRKLNVSRLNKTPRLKE